MTRINGTHHLLLLGKRGAILLLAGILSFASVINVFQPEQAAAAQLTPRSVLIGSSQGGVDTTYEFSWQMATASPVQSIIFEFCDAPLGTCTLPPSMDIFTGVTITDQSQFEVAGSFSLTTATGDCTAAGAATDTQLCVTRTAGTNEAANETDAIEFSSITNPTLSTAFDTVFVRMRIYSDTSFGTLVHDGTVAAAITQQLTTTGRVQERLEFCVAALDDALAQPANCGAFPTSTIVDLGVIDNASVAISPVDNSSTNPANDDFGAAMVDTNAAGGVVITYFPEVQTNVSNGDTDQLRSFRVAPTDCADNSLVSVYTDQCFESADNALGAAIPAGTELFGLYIACVVDSTGTTGGTLSDNALGAGIYDAYNGEDDSIVEAADCENEPATVDHEVAFRDDGTVDTIASSGTVVDHEMLKIRFAATASPTTPTGQYSVITTYIATATF